MRSIYQEFIHKSRHAKQLDNRKESWEETVDRYISFMHDMCTCKESVDWKELEQSILDMEVMPSMRAMMTAGLAAYRDNASIYNCSYLEIDCWKSYSEMMYLLMNGVGVGFSVENRCIKNLPKIADVIKKVDTKIVVQDDRIGWATAYLELLCALTDGKSPIIDYSLVRPAGTPLKTFGGRASGPASLRELFEFTKSLFSKRVGSKLSSLDCLDLACKTAETILCGGSRRSALICLFDKDDESIISCKSGNWYETHPHRRMSNNSGVYLGKPSREQFMHNWKLLESNKSGEPSFFNRGFAQEKTGRGTNIGINPCGEAILRPNEFCNLTEVVCRANDTKEALLHKIELATILGTLQSTITNFRFLRDDWKRNCENDRLLGVSLTGIYDLTETVLDAHTLRLMKETSHKVNFELSRKLDINRAASITCIKPSGTVSQLVDSSSGIHPRFSQYYIRAVRGSVHDPIYPFMAEHGVPSEPDVQDPDNTVVLYFPIKSPSIAKNITPIEHLEKILLFSEAYTDHAVSCTVSLAPSDWGLIGEWYYKNFDSLVGVTFLHKFDSVYKQMPYQACSEKEYKDLLDRMPTSIDWNRLPVMNDSAYQELACKGGQCEI